MPFTIHPSRSFPMCCPVTSQTGLSEGHGIVWNLSLSGWRLFGDVPLHGGKIWSLTIGVPNLQRVFVSAGVVCS